MGCGSSTPEAAAAPASSNHVKAPTTGSAGKLAAPASRLAAEPKALPAAGTGRQSADHATASSFIQLPAESGVLCEPDLRGVSSSGTSFKMKRSLQFQAELQQLSELSEHKSLMYSSDMAEVLRGVAYFKELLSVKDPPVAAIRASGVLPRLVELLQHDGARALQYAVVWTLTNICSAEHDDTQDVVDQGAVPGLIRLLTCCDDSPDLLQQVMWALGNIAADCEELQRMVLDEQVLPPLLQVTQRHAGSTTIVRHAMWLLANLSRPKPQCAELATALPLLLTILSTPHQDHEVQVHACWALVYLTSLPEVVDQLAAATSPARSTLGQLAQWVGALTPNLTEPALRVLGSLCGGSAQHTQAAVEAGVVPSLLACLRASSAGQAPSSLREVVWCLSNVAAGTPEQLQALLDAGAFPEVVSLLRASAAAPGGSGEELARECAYVVANPWAGSPPPALSQALLDAGLVKVLVELLQPSLPHSVVLLALEGLSNAVKRGQQMMAAAAKAAASVPVPEGSEPPAPPRNPIAAAMRACGAEAALGQLARCHEDEVLTMQAGKLSGVLQFL